MHTKTNHASACVSDDMGSPAWVSDDICNLARISDGISRPIRLWHVLPIKLHHVLLTHSQTPINRSLPKAFQQTKPSRAQAALEKIQKHSEVQKFYRNQASKHSRILRTSTSNSKNIWSRIIQTIRLDPKFAGIKLKSLQKP